MTPIGAKLRPVPLNSWVASRPRLRRQIAELVNRYPVVSVVGTAGSGKTTAVTDALASMKRPVAWLTLDDTEEAAGRLLVHLQQAAAVAVPDLPPVVDDALAASLPHVEAAGHLADALGATDLVLVLDEVEHLCDAAPALRVLSALIRSLSPSVRVILISRREVPLQLGGAKAIGGVGYLSEAELALTAQEAARVLDGLDRPWTTAEEAVRATGGWVAGVLFEAWRSPEHRHGTGGEGDALSGYLATEIMDGLTAEQQWFLEATSVLSVVTAGRAESLGLRDARAVLASLSRLHIPVSRAPDGSEMRCHQRFREFLRRRLDERGGADVRAIHAAHGRLLLRDGLVEDAVDAFLLAGELEAAGRAAERAVVEVLRRGDVEIARRWLPALPSEAVEGSYALTRAQLTLALDREAWIAGAEVADRLLRMLADRPAGQHLDPDLAGTIGTCYLHVGRFDDVFAVVEQAAPGPAREAWRVALGIDVTDRPEHYRDRPPDRGEVVDGLLHRIDYMHGRFDRLLDEHPAPWAASRSSRVAALCAVGRLDEALALFEEWPLPERSPAMTRIRIELLLELGRIDEAREWLARGRAVAARSSPYCDILHRLLEVTIALLVDRDTATATRLLDLIEEDPTALRRTRVADRVGIMRGLCALEAGDAETAALHLRQAVAVMREWDRLLLLAGAGVYLAEAEWRLGNEEAADEAADLALAVARMQRSDHRLLRALHRYPSVLSRRLDAEPGADSPWHALGRVLHSDRPAPVATPTQALVREFGTVGITIAEESIEPRLSRSVELVSYLAAHGGTCKKAVALVELFGEDVDDSTRAYLRQAIKRLRDALPDPAMLAADDVDITWTGARLVSESQLLEEAARLTHRLHGLERLDAIERALAVWESGEYLPGSNAPWVHARRTELEELALDLHLDASTVAFELGDLDRARRHADVVVRLDGYRESAWRLAMRIAAAMGHDDQVIGLYRQCRERLAEVPTQPAASTQRLLAELRR